MSKRQVILKSSPLFLFSISKQELDECIALSESHYDLLCRSVSKPGKGSFLNGWRNRILFNESSTVEVQCSWRELDTLLKILELSEYGSKAFELSVFVSQAMKQSQTISESWNATFEV